jgi:hypothetical protein
MVSDIRISCSDRPKESDPQCSVRAIDGIGKVTDDDAHGQTIDRFLGSRILWGLGGLRGHAKRVACVQSIRMHGTRYERILKTTMGLTEPIVDLCRLGKSIRQLDQQIYGCEKERKNNDHRRAHHHIDRATDIRMRNERKEKQ